MRARWRRLGALTATLLLTCLGAGAYAAPNAHADGPGTVDVEVQIPGQASGPLRVHNAQFRWGLNNETGSGAFFGGCNFISAGKVGDTGGGKVWTAEHGFFAPESGTVRIEKSVNENGRAVQRPVTFATKCEDADGRPVTTNNFTSTGIQAVIDQGSGTVDATRQQASIRWQGSFTVVFYGGLSYWWLSDPKLEIDGGNGRVTATLGGFGTSMQDMTKWEPLPETEVTVAELRNVSVDADNGFIALPDYRGVQIEVPDSPQLRTGNNWGSFPESFVRFQQLTGQAGYWYSTGGLRDPVKPATRIYVSYDADRPLTPDPASDQQVVTGGADGPDLTGPAGPLDGSLGGPLGGGSGGGGSADGALPAGPAAGTGGPLAGVPLPPAAPGPLARLQEALTSPAALFGGHLALAKNALADTLGWLANPRNRLLTAAGVGLSATFLLGLGLRQGWLVLPWRRHLGA